MGRRIAAVVASLLVLSSCLQHEPMGVAASNATLLIHADLTGTPVATVVVEITAPDIATPLVFNIATVQGIATGSITVSAGSNRTITLRAFDAGGVETHTGAVTLDVRAGTNPAVAIVLAPLAGDLPITVTLGSFTVTVQPPTATVAPGDTVHLTATILDANSTPVSGQVAWATLAAGVATLVSTGAQAGRLTGVGPGSTTVVAMYGGVAGAATVTVTQSFGAGPLRVSSINPRYLTDGTGRAIYLTGSHTWKNFQDAGFTDPPAAFDWTGYLNFQQQHHHNLIKLWRWEQAKWSAETTNQIWFNPMPYPRPGPGTALDGKPKFDVMQFNPAYFARMRQHVIDAGQRGIYVSIMLFNGWSIEDKSLGVGNPWPGHPFNRNNNINGIDGDPNQDGEGLETHTLQVAAIVALQEAYVRRVVDAVNDLDNVLYEISNETRGMNGAAAWQYHMIDYLKQYEATKPKQHPVGMTVFSPDGNNDDLYASPADWIAPNRFDAVDDDAIQNPVASDGRKVILYDTDHICGICVNKPWVWKSLTQGLSPVVMDPYDGTFPVVAPFDLSDPQWTVLRTNLGYALTYATRMNVIAMQPHGELASTGYCLAHIGVEYLVYLPGAGTVTVNLTGTTGTLVVEWFNPSTGQTTAGGTTTGGVQTFTAPNGGDAVLYLHQ